MPAYQPQLATLVQSAPAQGFVHELKYDGYRIGCALEDGDVRLTSRNGKDWTGNFPGLVKALGKLPAESALLDGEVAMVLPDGRTSFQALQNGAAGDALRYFVFDLLYLDGEDLRSLPLVERKARLEKLLSRAPKHVHYAEHVETSGQTMLEAVRELGGEGIVSKRANAPYRTGRNLDWQKLKCGQRQELAIGGFTEPRGSRVGVGALLLGYYEDGALKFAGKVGTGKGMNAKMLSELRTRLDKLERKTSAYDPKPKASLVGAGVHWVRPELVAEIGFTEWTNDGRIRHPTLEGLRKDKVAADVTRERPKGSKS